MLCAQIGLRGRPQALAGQGGARAKLHRALGELGAQRPRGAGGGAQRCGEGGGQNQRCAPSGKFFHEFLLSAGGVSRVFGSKDYMLC